jgi:hypothetical protein
VTADAAVGLDDVEKLALALDVRVDAVTRRPSARECGRIRHLDHRVPVDRRIVLRRGFLIRRLHGGEVELFAGLAVDLRGIDEAIAAHPDLVLRLRQIGDDIAALIVGDDHLGHLGAEIGGFRDHPHARLRAGRASDHAADIIGVDGNGDLSAELRRRHGQVSRGGGDGHTQ